MARTKMKIITSGHVMCKIIPQVIGTGEHLICKDLKWESVVYIVNALRSSGSQFLRQV